MPDFLGFWFSVIFNLYGKTFHPAVVLGPEHDSLFILPQYTVMRSSWTITTLATLIQGSFNQNQTDKKNGLSTGYWQTFEKTSKINVKKHEEIFSTTDFSKLLPFNNYYYIRQSKNIKSQSKTLVLCRYANPTLIHGLLDRWWLL